MNVWDAVLHLSNLLWPAVMLGAMAAALTKLIWRGELRGVAWRRLFAWSAVPSMLVVVAGLVLQGRDGRMSTYAAMVMAAALGLWWAGFARPRRSP